MSFPKMETSIQIKLNGILMKRMFDDIARRSKCVFIVHDVFQTNSTSNKSSKELMMSSQTFEAIITMRMTVLIIFIKRWKKLEQLSFSASL